LDGFALLERIRQSEEPRIRSMPVIVISGDEDDATKSARARRERTISSPDHRRTEILSRIDNLRTLVEAKQQLVVNKQALDQTVTATGHGLSPPHYLVTEGGSTTPREEARRAAFVLPSGWSHGFPLWAMASCHRK